MQLQRGSSMTTDKHVDPAAAVPAGDEEEDTNLQVAGIVSKSATAFCKICTTCRNSPRACTTCLSALGLTL